MTKFRPRWLIFEKKNPKISLPKDQMLSLCVKIGWNWFSYFWIIKSLLSERRTDRWQTTGDQKGLLTPLISVVIRGITLLKHKLNSIIKPMHVKQLTIPCPFWGQSWSFGWFFSLLACSHILHNLIFKHLTSLGPDHRAMSYSRWKSSIFSHMNIYFLKKLTCFEYRNNTVWHYTRNYRCIDKTVFKII